MRLRFLIVGLVMFLASCASIPRGPAPFCLTGAFLSDRPRAADIHNFKNSFGKQPYFVMIFTDWSSDLDDDVVRDVYASGSLLLVTWEPWQAAAKQALDYDALIRGQEDKKIKAFARRLKEIGKPVYLRFAHEMNGDWYPWSGGRIGKEKYVALYRHVKDVFYAVGADNVRWIFSINAEDVPGKNNYFMQYYPGDAYVDCIGIDGYNWGDTQSWSHWRSFRDIFQKRYDEIITRTDKPVMITEFASTSSGGDKVRWIQEAMDALKMMPEVMAFVVFNVDKETDWSIPAGSLVAEQFRKALKDDGYFQSRRPSQRYSDR